MRCDLFGPPSAPEDAGTAPAPRSPPTRQTRAASVAVAGRPSRSAARHTSARSPDGSAAATSKSERVWPAAPDAAPEALLDPLRDRSDQPEPPRQLRPSQAGRQLQQG